MVSKNDPCLKAFKYFQNNDYNRAYENIQKCNKNIKQQLKSIKKDYVTRNKIKFQLAKTTDFEAQILIRQNKIPAARRCLSEAITLLQGIEKEAETIELMSQISYSYGVTALVNQNFSEAKEFFTKSKNNYFSVKMYEQGVDILFKLIDLCKIDEVDEKSSLLKELETNAKQIKNKKNKGKILGLLKFMNINNNSEMDPDNKIKELIKLRKNFSKLNLIEEEIQVIMKIAEISESISIEKSEEYYLNALDLAKTNNSSKLLGIIYTQLGLISLKTGKLQVGQDRLLLGLKHRTESGDYSGSAQTLIELSRITFIMSKNDDDIQKAKNLIDQALEIYEKIDNDSFYAMALELASSINTRLKNYNLAEQQVEKGRKLFKIRKDKNGEARMLTQLGIILDLQNKDEEAILVLNKAEKIFHSTNNLEGLAQIYQVKGFNLSKSDKNEAIKFLNKSKTLYQQVYPQKETLENITNFLNNEIQELS